jgi:hypothetical protein
MKIYGDTNSGNCLKVKWVCDALAHEGGFHLDVMLRRWIGEAERALRLTSAR